MPSSAAGGARLSFPRSDAPRVSILVPVHNGCDETYACLRSVLANTEGVAYEVLVADDASDDDTAELAQWTENVRAVRDGVRRGFLRNCNNAARFARGEFLVLLNNDTVVQPDWLRPLVEILDRDASIGMAGGKLLFPDGRLQEAGGIIWKDASGWNYGRGDSPEEPDYNYVKEVDYVSAACLIVRRRLWEEIGGFDDRYAPAYYEDADLAFEVRARGYKVVYQPLAAVVHVEGASHGGDPNAGVKRAQAVNRNVFRQKWRDVLASEHYEPGSRVFHARDRTARKATLLVVDHYVPRYDRDAGGRCTYQYLRLFAELGFHVVFVGSNYVRAEPYTTVLQQLGIVVLYGGRYARGFEEWLRRHGLYIDYAYLNRPHIGMQYVELIKRYAPCSRIGYFPVDLHFVRELRSYRTSGDVGGLDRARRWMGLEFDLLRKVDIVHVVSSYEEDLLRTAFPDKIVRRIPLYLLNGGPSVSGRPYALREDLLFVGTGEHLPNSDALEWLMDEILPLLRGRLPRARALVVGSWSASDQRRFERSGLEVAGCVSDDELERLYAAARLVIAPLRFGAGVKGKVVEALSHGVPTVTTPVGAEGLPGVERCVAIARDAREFAQRVAEIYEDEALWQRMSVRSLDYAKAEFSSDRAARLITLDFDPSRRLGMEVGPRAAAHRQERLPTERSSTSPDVIYAAQALKATDTL
jgi:O-antigen biosynthesis protein